MQTVALQLDAAVAPLNFPSTLRADGNLVELAHAGEPHDAGAGKFDAQFERPACGLDEPAQRGEVKVGLALYLEPRLCAICSWLRSASKRSAFNPSTSR
jgi:hypothetical protein